MVVVRRWRGWLPAAWPRSDLARLVVLACTLIGLTAMHSLGHGARGGDPHTPPAGAVDRMVAADCVGLGCAHLTGLPGTGDHPTGWDVCVAVLTALAVAGLLAAVALAVAGRRVPAVPGSRVGSAPRAPPARPVGLAVATVSVLRT